MVLCPYKDTEFDPVCKGPLTCKVPRLSPELSLLLLGLYWATVTDWRAGDRGGRGGGRAEEKL